MSEEKKLLLFTTQSIVLFIVSFFGISITSVEIFLGGGEFYLAVSDFLCIFAASFRPEPRWD